MTESDLKLRIAKYIVAYFDANAAEPVFEDRVPNLGIIGRRFGTLCRKRFNKSVEELLETDEYFTVSVKADGCTLVYCDELLSRIE